LKKFIYFSIDLIPNGDDSTELLWHYTVTGHSKLGTELLKTELTLEKFAETVQNNEKDLQYFFKNRSMRNRSKK
jgi:hypothetical protein